MTHHAVTPLDQRVEDLRRALAEPSPLPREVTGYRNRTCAACGKCQLGVLGGPWSRRVLGRQGHSAPMIKVGELLFHSSGRCVLLADEAADVLGVEPTEYDFDAEAADAALVRGGVPMPTRVRTQPTEDPKLAARLAANPDGLVAKLVDQLEARGNYHREPMKRCLAAALADMGWDDTAEGALDAAEGQGRR